MVCAIALWTYPKFVLRILEFYAIDIWLNQNKSAETRLEYEDDSYGKWINE